MVASLAPSVPLRDVLIVGGGPGGLAAATGLARQLYSAVVFDSGVYRNARSEHMHNVPTWDHRNPKEYRTKARDDLLARYNTIHFENTAVESIHRTAKGHFEAMDSSGGTWTGRKVILATGVRDIFPEIDNYSDVWVKGIFHCLFCHGYEERGAASAGVLALGDLANTFGSMHMGRMARRLAEKVTIYTDGNEELAEQLRTTVADDPVMRIDNRSIQRLSKGSQAAEVDITLAGGDVVTEGFIAHKPKTEVNGPFARQLALELTDQGDIKTNGAMYESSVPGVFAVGDCATFMKGVTNAVAMGTVAAAAVAGQLQAEIPQKL